MRPEAIANPKSRALRLKLWVIARLMGMGEAPEPLRLFLARPRFASASGAMMKFMHNPESFWSAGARELMATHVSARFQCPF